jgi:hypothetical protein
MGGLFSASSYGVTNYFTFIEFSAPYEPSNRLLWHLITTH